MNLILRLYPRPWRDRYLVEMTELLSERSPGPRGQVDLARGALDAWLHPQVTGPARSDDEPIVRPVLAAAIGVVVGLMWVVGGVAQHAGGYDPITGYKVGGGTMLVLAATFMAGLAAVTRVWSTPAPTRALRAAAVGMFVAALFAFLPWPILVIGYWGHMLMTMLFGLRLHEAGQRTATLLSVGALVATTFNTETAFALATVPLGIAWIVASLSGVVRRPVTIEPVGV